MDRPCLSNMLFGRGSVKTKKYKAVELKSSVPEFEKKCIYYDGYECNMSPYGYLCPHKNGVICSISGKPDMNAFFMNLGKKTGEINFDCE